MITRRSAMKLAAAGAAGIVVQPFAFSQNGELASKRPARADRKFVSEAVEGTIAEVKRVVGENSRLGWLFENCFPNTLDTTVRVGTVDGKPDTFVITGDIPAMWLRDSSAQVWPYLPLASREKKLQMLLAGVIHRQNRCILIDPYANAFNYDHEGSEFDHDLTKMRPELHERKWEIDSLCYPIRLAHGYWKATGDASPLDGQWREAMRAVIRTFREQQRKENQGPYSFQRNTETPNDTLNLAGFGNPIKPCGLIASGFRPSDDACIYPFLIPSNLFAVTAMKKLAELAMTVGDTELARMARELGSEVSAAVARYGKASHLGYGTIYAFEVDGYGNQIFMDDANVPSLLSLPYLGAVTADDKEYQNTRRFVLSDENPYFFRGKAAQGVGGPHAGKDMIWPLAIIMQGLTSSDDKEIAECLRTLGGTHAGTGFMHETFHKDDPAKFTRAWFAWANTLFGEFVLSVMHTRPKLLASVAG
jgi:meiotically up-regulated gene 157 (Mug157) protein